MSNASVGNIYHQIINEVIEASRVDFEDQGVGEEVLEELRKVCPFLPLLPSAMQLIHTNTRTSPRCRVHPAARIRALLHSIPHAFRASKLVSFLDCTGLCLLPCRALLVGRPGCLCCLFAAAAGSGRWRGLRVRERRRAGGWESGLTDGCPGAIWVF